jgi:cytoskeletal protein CcmA (bactofilin family)
LPADKLADFITVIDPCRSKTMKLTLKHAIAAIILMLRFPTPGGAGPLEDADAAIKRRDYATAVRLIRPSPYSTDGHSAAPEATSSISSGLSIVGKIVGQGRLGIFGHVEGEVHASTVQIGDGAQVVGDIVAEELTIGGRVKGTIHANRVKLTSTALVEGDIYHRSLAIEENAQFEGMSKRQENAIDTPSRVPGKRSQAQAINEARGNTTSNSRNP